MLILSFNRWTQCYISRVSDQNGICLLYIMLQIHHSGREPSIYHFIMILCRLPLDTVKYASHRCGSCLLVVLRLHAVSVLHSSVARSSNALSLPSDDVSDSYKYEMELQTVPEVNHVPSPQPLAPDTLSDIQPPPSPGANTNCPPYESYTRFQDGTAADDFSDNVSGMWKHGTIHFVFPGSRRYSTARLYFIVA